MWVISIDHVVGGKFVEEWFAKLSKDREGWTKKLEGTRIIATYWTLGRYDAVVIVEAKDEEEMMKVLMSRDPEFSTSETLVGLTREEVLKLIE